MARPQYATLLPWYQGTRREAGASRAEKDFSHPGSHKRSSGFRKLTQFIGVFGNVIGSCSGLAEAENPGLKPQNFFDPYQRSAFSPERTDHVDWD
ncbi:MAG TPA: hypothetical protein VKW06_15820 [Candidatus Angelobacter sp.]|nr:hypothetical protein [Candidatus Angelobacter sp.]